MFLTQNRGTENRDSVIFNMVENVFCIVQDYSSFILRTQLHDPHFFQNRCHFQYNISWIKTKSADVILKMTTISKEMRIVQLYSVLIITHCMQLSSKNEQTLVFKKVLNCDFKIIRFPKWVLGSYFKSPDRTK